MIIKDNDTSIVNRVAIENSCILSHHDPSHPSNRIEEGKCSVCNTHDPDRGLIEGRHYKCRACENCNTFAQPGRFLRFQFSIRGPFIPWDCACVTKYFSDESIQDLLANRLIGIAFIFEAHVGEYLEIVDRLNRDRCAVVFDKLNKNDDISSDPRHLEIIKKKLNDRIKTAHLKKQPIE